MIIIIFVCAYTEHLWTVSWLLKASLRLLWPKKSNKLQTLKLDVHMGINHIVKAFSVDAMQG